MLILTLNGCQVPPDRPAAGPGRDLAPLRRLRGAQRRRARGTRRVHPRRPGVVRWPRMRCARHLQRCYYYF